MVIDANIPLFSSRSGSEESANGLNGFIYQYESNDYLCPNKKILKACKSKYDTILFITKGSDCYSCNIASKCQAKLKNGGPIRRVSRNKNADLFTEVRSKMEQEEFKQKLYKRLWMIEGIMNELKKCKD